MATAFVLAGGRSLGATEVGRLAAFTVVGVHPDFVGGASVDAADAIKPATSTLLRGGLGKHR